MFFLLFIFLYSKIIENKFLRKDVLIMWKKVICWIVVLIWLMVIYSFSARNGINSDYQSRVFIVNMSKSVVKIANYLKLTNTEPTHEQYYKFAYAINGIVRKLAHGFIYFILAILIMVALSINKNITYMNVLITVIVCFIYSITDEYHQSFVDGRTGLLIDCVIDTFGAILGSSIYVLFCKIFHKKVEE